MASLTPIIPTICRDPFDGPAWLFDLKLDGFRGLADIVGRMLSKNGNRLKRFEPLLDTLPAGYVFDGEIVALDNGGRPVFNDLLFQRRSPVYVAFDVLIADGDDVRGAPLKERRGTLSKIVHRYGLQRCEPVLGEGIAMDARWLYLGLRLLKANNVVR